MKIKTLFTFLLLTLFFIPAHALSVRHGLFKNKSMFGIRVAGEVDEMSYYGRVNSVNSISLQYYQTGTFMVTEVVIDMKQSPLQLRLYHTKLLTLNEMKQGLPSQTNVITQRETPEAVQRLIDAGKKPIEDKVNTTVIKDYPISTHAKTIEFSISSQSELTLFYRTFKGYLLGEEDIEVTAVDSNDQPIQGVISGLSRLTFTLN